MTLRDDRRCKNCGDSIAHLRPQARHCNGSCRAAASRARKAAKAQAERERRSGDETAQKRTRPTTEVVEWDLLPPGEQTRIAGILERNADLIGMAT